MSEKYVGETVFVVSVDWLLITRAVPVTETVESLGLDAQQIGESANHPLLIFKKVGFLQQSNSSLKIGGQKRGAVLLGDSPRR